MLLSRFCIALALAMAGHACSDTIAGEFTASECADNADNDGDLLFNCDDPDCQAYDYCRTQTGHAAGSPAPAGGGAPALEDAGPAPDANAASDEDAGMIVDPPDAGMPPCGGMCSPTQVCIDDVCEDVSSPGLDEFELRILTVDVPDFNMWAQCLDPCDDSAFPSYGFCACAPDPYVEVWRIRAQDEQEVTMHFGSTTVAVDERTPSFEDATLRIDLMAEDALSFVVMDADPDRLTDATIYTCRHELGAIAVGPIECSTTVVPFLPPYTLRAELEPVP
jgi:hypothetical protein